MRRFCPDIVQHLLPSRTILPPEPGSQIFPQCGGCSSVAYCSRECQHEDWGRHRTNCYRVQGTRLTSSEYTINICYLRRSVDIQETAGAINMDSLRNFELMPILVLNISIIYRSHEIIPTLRQRFLHDNPTLDPHLAVLDVDYTMSNHDLKPFTLKFRSWTDLSRDIPAEQQAIRYLKEMIGRGTLYYVCTVAGNGADGKDTLINPLPSIGVSI